MNNINLQRELEKIIESTQREGLYPKLLLHACCAPCSSYCMEYLNKYFEISIYFYNPNIDDSSEYLKRVEEEKRLISEMDFVREVSFIEGEYEPEDFYKIACGMEDLPEGGKRCLSCYEMRLLNSAIYAKEHDYDYFTTTLSISPMKNAKVLYDIGCRVGGDIGIKYLPSDFKKKNGYKRSIELSKQYRLYRQDYCGCSYSRREGK